ncbi:MAG: hypothetical protein QG630_11 [Patescibacteria group bacterium]|nr:hypothetical protein [Patescibacteria group bacterium]
MKPNQSHRTSPVDDLFNKQKEKVNILAEIFNNKDFFLKDFIIKEILIKRKITKKGFVWLKNRIIELKSGHTMIPTR